MKYLFICECNINRSPTFENWVNKNTKHKARSTGIRYGYPDLLTQELLDWADVVMVMDLKQLRYIQENDLNHDHIYVLGISDEYVPDDPLLIDLIEYFWNTFKEMGK